jgi:hypothetical protein
MAEDWRLRNQADYLTGVVLYRRKYVAPSKDWDHDHCMFCWATFREKVESPRILTEGFATADGLWWICDTCFNDFRQQFRWILAEAPIVHLGERECN